MCLHVTQNIINNPRNLNLYRSETRILEKPVTKVSIIYLFPVMMNSITILRGPTSSLSTDKHLNSVLKEKRKRIVNYRSCGRVASSVLEYSSRPPPLSILKYLSDARSVYSFVTAKRSTQTPASTACAACNKQGLFSFILRQFNDYVLQQSLSTLSNN
jgi:hypothetical protein